MYLKVNTAEGKFLSLRIKDSGKMNFELILPECVQTCRIPA